jgi:hypothetical protein
MKVCPHCDTEIPEKQRKCPSCGAYYWDAEDPIRDTSIEEEKEEENEGCLSIFAVHFFVALAAFVSLLFVGYVIHLLVHFEENQIKVIWTGAALLLAAAISGIIAKLRQKK